MKYGFSGRIPSFAIESNTTFLLAGIPPGTYDVIFDAGENSGFDPLIIEAVKVVIGETTDMDINELQ